MESVIPKRAPIRLEIRTRHPSSVTAVGWASVPE
jgi:hypothetical protein